MCYHKAMTFDLVVHEISEIEKYNRSYYRAEGLVKYIPQLVVSMLKFKFKC